MLFVILKVGQIEVLSGLSEELFLLSGNAVANLFLALSISLSSKPCNNCNCPRSSPVTFLQLVQQLMHHLGLRNKVLDTMYLNFKWGIVCCIACY